MPISTLARGSWDIPSNSIDTYWKYGIVTNAGFTTNLAWTTNMIVYLPVVVKSRVRGIKMWSGSGTTGTGSLELGIYDRAGAQVTNSEIAVTKVAAAEETISAAYGTPPVFGPGLYYLAQWISLNTSTFYGSSVAAPVSASNGARVEINASGLPATATWTVAQTLAVYPVIGVLLEGTPA